ncbi:hypothetical protein ACFL1B_06355, partial [Nanoarchaeota archaeon]
MAGEEQKDEEITTNVDQLLELLKQYDKLALQDASAKLGVDQDVVQSWVDFLVEEQIVGIEYKFTKPFIYLNKPEPEKQKQKEDTTTLIAIKEDFRIKAVKKNIPEQNIQALWQNHLSKALERKRQSFYEEAAKRQLQNTDQLWVDYCQRL